MRYSLRQLEVFLATAQFENVSRAAASLAMSQSAASSALRELEQQFDVQLFDRLGKRLKLSELGRQLRPRAEHLLEQARAFEQAMSGDDATGSLKLGATLTIGNYLAVGMIAQFKEAYPRANIALSVANTSTIAEQVASFELDLGMIEGELHHPDLEMVDWREDELQVFGGGCVAGHLCSPGGLFMGVNNYSAARRGWFMEAIIFSPHFNWSLRSSIASFSSSRRNSRSANRARATS